MPLEKAVELHLAGPEALRHAQSNPFATSPAIGFFHQKVTGDANSFLDFLTDLRGFAPLGFQPLVTPSKLFF